MNKKKKLAEVEFEIMSAIWPFGKPITVKEIHLRLYPKKEKAYTTVQTIMNILVEKGFLRKDKIGMVNFYFPIVPKEDFAKHATHNLVSKIFNGSFGALANYLVDSDNLTRDELNDLKSLINAKEEKGGGK